VDGKHGGEYHMTITRQDDGTTVLTAHANVRLSYVGGLYKYTYSFRGNEVWKDGRLVRMDSASNDDGKQFSVNAVADGNALRVRVNGQEHASRPDVWTTTYWRLPDAQYRNRGVPLLDADTGRDINGALQYVGTSQLTVAGQVKTCTRYRVTGGVQVELWYDDQERMVRQESVEDGHRMLLELTGVRR
jgi:hypothetical protein